MRTGRTADGPRPVDRLRALVAAERGRTIAELHAELALDIRPTSKNVTSVVINRLIDLRAPGLRSELDSSALRRVVRADESTFRPKESVSFAAFEFLDVIATPWAESPLRERIARIAFVVLLTPRGGAVGDARLHDAFGWDADDRTLATMEQEYEMFRRAFAEDDPALWPRAGTTETLHVRPHGRDGKDVLPLPHGRTHVRSSFWLNQSFVQLLIRLNAR
jgi:DNA mismatch repair protein MutH